MMAAMERSEQGSETHIHAPAGRCPYWPVGSAVIHGSIYLPPAAQAIFASLVAHPAIAAQTESQLRISEYRSHQKRGPPSSISSL
jgi:hypothetical protein